jgi:multimeric flavodoxin WrbA
MNVGSRVNKGEVNAAVNEAVEALKTTDAIIVGSPVYYASPSGEMLMFLDRLFGKAEAELRFMPAATIASARRGGTTATLDVLNK